MRSVLLLYRAAVFADAPGVAGSAATAVTPGTAAAASACGDAVGTVNDDDAVGTTDGAELPVVAVGNLGAVGADLAKGKRQLATDFLGEACFERGKPFLGTRKDASYRTQGVRSVLSDRFFDNG